MVGRDSSRARSRTSITTAIPWIIYTSPEIAWVGKSEQQAKAAGIAVRTGQFPFSINGRALGINEPTGFVKIVADATTDQVLGVHIIHARASDLIQEGVTTMEFKGAAEDIARITHGHPDALRGHARSGAQRRQARAKYVAGGPRWPLR